jgi:subtilisin-like proprotein convertase family protein
VADFGKKSALETVTAFPPPDPTSGRSCNSFAAGLAGFTGAVLGHHAARLTLTALLWLGLMARAAVDVGDPGLTGLPKQTQTISFGALASRTFGDAPFTLNATASSGLLVTFVIVSGPAILTNGNVVSITGGGTVTVRASQGGDATYAAAPSVEQSFTVAKSNPTTESGAGTNKLLGNGSLAVSGSRGNVGGAALVADSVTFENLATISIPSSGAATPYPSTIVVSGTSGTIAKVTVRLNQLSHTFPDDLDFLLVGPTGATVLLMASCGGGGVLSGVTITFDDSASDSVPSNLISTGSYRPTQRGTPTFPAPAPAAPYAATLTAYLGTSANGTWSLFAHDHSKGDSGEVAGGWSLTVESTTQPLITSSLVATATVGASFNYLLTAINTPSTYAATGLPPGLSINPASGQISGIPTAAGRYSVTLSATNTAGTVTADLTLKVGIEFNNLASISIPGSGTSGPAAPYPSSIMVTGMAGNVGSVIVRFNQLSHTFPVDVSVLLVGPTGVGVLLMAQCGGGTAATGVTLTFDDGAAEFPSPLVTGTYRPTQNGSPTFDAPAPNGPYATTLVNFTGTSANGTWSLFAYDGADNDVGQIAGGWSLSIVPDTPVITSSLAANGTVGVPINYAITASNLPTSFNATGLPTGLSVNTTTGVITGTPAAAGSFGVALSATNAAGTGTADLVLTIAKGSQTITFGALPDKNYGDAPFALSATASSGLTPSFSIVSGPATVSGNTVTLTDAGTVLARASQAGNANYNASPDVDQSFNVMPNFASWQASKFTAAELLNANVSGPNAVYGLDGLSNLVKYALGLEPKTDITTGLPAVTILGTDWCFTYTRPTSVTDVTYTVEVSTNLTTWTTAGVTHTLVSSAGGIETWRGQYPLGSAGNAFFRLNVTQP